MNTITIVGSINLDRTIRVKRLPKPGETLAAKETFSAGGGKGANQAVAARRAGANTYFIGAVGNDNEGNVTLDLLKQEGIDVSAVTQMDNTETGQAYIMVDDEGENSIIIQGGANQAFKPDHIEENEAIISKSDFVIAQFESPVDSTIRAFEIAREKGVTTILNPAPALEEVPEALLKVTDVIIPNETETEELTGLPVHNEEDLKKAAAYFHDLGIRVVIITIGSKGAFFDGNGQQGLIPALKVKAIDTTAAGDTFIGAMSSVLKPNLSNLEEAVTFGNHASAQTVQHYGAQPSIPFKEDIK